MQTPAAVDGIVQSLVTTTGYELGIEPPGVPPPVRLDRALSRGLSFQEVPGFGETELVFDDPENDQDGSPTAILDAMTRARPGLHEETFSARGAAQVPVTNTGSEHGVEPPAVPPPESRSRLPSQGVAFHGVPGFAETALVLDDPQNEQEVPAAKLLPSAFRVPSRLSRYSSLMSSACESDLGTESYTASIAGFANMFRRSSCIICFSENQEMAIDPCGHMSMCSKCTPKATVCPVCKGPIEKALRIFVAGSG